MSESTIITYSFTKDGVTVEDTHNLLVDKVPASLAISGPNTVAEGGNSIALVATVTYTDSTTKVVSITDWAASNASATIVATTGIVTSSDNIVGNKTTDITCSYTEGNVTINALYTINITDTIIRPASIAISGPTTVNEGSNTINLVATVTYDDSTTAIITNSSTWSSDNPSVASVGATTGTVTSADNIIGNQSANISVSYTQNGVTVNNTYLVTVTEAIKRPVSLAISGPTTVNEGQNTINLVATVTYDDATTAVVTTGAVWSSSNTSFATVGASTGVVTSANNIIGNKAVNISASFTDASVTVNAPDYAITVVEAIKRPVSVALTGPSQVNEGSQTINLVATVTYDDTTTAVVTTSGTWSSSNTSVATVGAATGVVTSAASVAADTNVTITFSITQAGVTVNNTKIITVKDVPAGLPLARFGYGVFVGPNFDQNGFTGPQTVMDSILSSQISGNTDGVTFLGPGGNGETTYGYFAYPVELGILTQAMFQDTSNSFTGGWEGVDAPFDVAVPYIDWMPSGPRTVTMDDGSGARSWYLYRTDFPIQNLTFRVINFPNN